MFLYNNANDILEGRRTFLSVTLFQLGFVLWKGGKITPVGISAINFLCFFHTLEIF